MIFKHKKKFIRPCPQVDIRQRHLQRLQAAQDQINQIYQPPTPRLARAQAYNPPAEPNITAWLQQSKQNELLNLQLAQLFQFI